jgi:HAD superfamily hydrolase (TIGR01509 family)
MRQQFDSINLSTRLSSAACGFANTQFDSMIHGIIFDLDGTLLDSGLDFDLMRSEMGLPAGRPILESLAAHPADDLPRCHDILHRHELAGAERAEPLPGVVEFLVQLHARGLRLAVVTRNSRPITQAMLAKLPVPFDPVITREDGPVKPDPWAIQRICESWQVPPQRVVMIGDYWFDIACGRAAGARTALYAPIPRAADGHETTPDLVFPCFTQAELLWQWLVGRTSRSVRDDGPGGPSYVGKSL